MSTMGLKIMAAYVLDGLLGDPEGYPHPVRLMGGLIERMARSITGREAGDSFNLWAGCFLAGTLTCGAYTCARILLMLPARSVTEIFLLYTTLARKNLAGCSLSIAHDLEKGDIDLARSHIKTLVGRDPEEMDEYAIARAAVESVAENLVDGVLAPLFWAAMGGAPAAMAFKAVSTLDSMIGHRDEGYLYVGKCSARIDDAAVFLAARASIPLIAAASWLCGYDARSAWSTGLKDRLKHESPNSAHAEAAFAGALGLKLGGSSQYRGKTRSLPEIGDGTRKAEPGHIKRAVRIMNATSLLAVVLALVYLSGKR